MPVSLMVTGPQKRASVQPITSSFSTCYRGFILLSVKIYWSFFHARSCTKASSHPDFLGTKSLYIHHSRQENQRVSGWETKDLFFFSDICWSLCGLPSYPVCTDCGKAWHFICWYKVPCLVITFKALPASLSGQHHSSQEPSFRRIPQLT